MTEITFSECEALFTQDVKIAEQIIRRFVPKVGQYVIQGLGEGLKKGSYAISPIRERALINMAFNLGYRLSGFKKFLAAVNAEDWETAAKEMMDSKWAQQVGDRAVRLRDQILNG
jgi:GH24 family phage-related lysozyme (muramidase)